MMIANMVRERDFAEFVQYADEQELLRQRQLLHAELNTKYANARTPLTEIMRDRLNVLDRTLGLAA